MSRTTQNLRRFVLPLAATLTSSFALAQSQPIKIMSMGDSITIGVDYYTNSSGGYRNFLVQDLINAGISFTMVGANTSGTTPTLIGNNDTHHNGYGSWEIHDLNANLDAVTPPSNGDSNLGGYFITGGNGTGRAAVSPDLLLLEAGTNDMLQGNPNITQDLYTLITHFHALSPNTKILVAGITPINNVGFQNEILTFNAYIRNTIVPALPYTMYVDQNTGLLNPDGSVNANLLGADNIHPDNLGYPVLGSVWATAVEQALGVTPPTAPTQSTPTTSTTAQAGSGTNLGTFAFLNGSATAGNSLVDGNGVSMDGNGMITYWGPDASIQIMDMGNSQYELVENVGNRCLAADGAAITMATCNGNADQLFSLNLQTDGSYQVASATKTCLSVAGAFNSAFALACNQSASQSWTISGRTPLNLGSTTSTPVSSPSSTTSSSTSSSSTGSSSTSTSTPASTGNTAASAPATTSTSPATTSNNLGTFAFLNGSASAGNSIITNYGTSFDGDALVTYWGPQSTIEILSMGNSQYELIETTGGRCISADGGSVAINGCTGNADQLFALNLQGDGSYQVKASAGTCLSATDAFSQVFAVACNSSASQSWTITGSSPLNLGASSTTSSSTTTAPATTDSSTTTPPASSTPTNTSSTTTTSTSMPTSTSTPATTTNLGSFALLNGTAAAGNSLIDGDGVSFDGNNLVTYWGPQSSIQIASTGNGQYQLIENTGNRCLTTNGSNLTMSTCTSASSQLFSLGLQVDGSFQIKAVSGACLSVAGAFQQAAVLSCDSSPSQSWTIPGFKP